MNGARDGLVTIGEAARRVGVAPSALRFYEREGLLRPAQRGNAGYRLYSREDVERLRFLRSAQAAGFALKDIRALLSFADAADAGRQRDVQRLIEQRLAEVDTRLSELRRLRAPLRRALDRCRACRGKKSTVLEDLRTQHQGEKR